MTRDRTGGENQGEGRVEQVDVSLPSSKLPLPRLQQEVESVVGDRCERAVMGWCETRSA